jgi:hypothetical protein
MTPSFSGQIKQGKLHLEDRGSFLNHLNGLEGKRVMVTVAKETRRRTNSQNAYLWGVIYKLISDYTGATPEELHIALKYHFGKKRFIGNIVAPASTKAMDTIEMTEYIEKVRRWAAEELNINIPDPNEVVV